MKHIRDLAQTAVSQIRSSSLCPQLEAASPAPNTIRLSEKGETSISVFTDRPATNEEIEIWIAKLHFAFPKMEPGFWSVLSERIHATNFTVERLKEAVNNVLDNFHYKELTVSDIIGYDRRERLYTYKEVCKEWMNG
ncbi:MAG: hypothetical protein LBJ17_08635, partial [Dysgonamonadaceae bacterium]|nr:hypothetical protein [Dysgonamonadaceae bacterium]